MSNEFEMLDWMLMSDDQYNPPKVQKFFSAKMADQSNPNTVGAGTSSPAASCRQTPSPPPNEQSPQLGMGGGGTGAGPCSSTSMDQLGRTPPLYMSGGMRAAQSLAEWQLQAVLFRARLAQYFDVFISQGGDDVDQFMQCDEAEFLEIMSLVCAFGATHSIQTNVHLSVGMASKPLHVRRLQRTLKEFSENKAQFLIGVVPFIGLPPTNYPSSLSTAEILSAILHVLVPDSKGPLDLSGLSQQVPCPPPPMGPDFLFQLPQTAASVLPPHQFLGQRPADMGLVASATAIPLPRMDQHFLLSLVNQSFAAAPPNSLPGTSKRARMSSSPPSTPLLAKEQRHPDENAGVEEQQQRSALEQLQHQQFQSMSPSSCSSPADRLTGQEVLRLGQLAHELVAQLPAKLEPRVGHGKRRMERGLLEAISLPLDDPLRAEYFRLFARIYGRFDAKRRPDKPLTRNERIVNEAAAQLSLLRPELLARRDELFPLARKLARMFELPMGGATATGAEQPTSPERSCSAASSTAESAVGTPKERETFCENEERRTEE